ncbi:prefoldin subunit 2 isoform X1 [Papio anubis]|uniref:prefoldin subunit 2 isoform X1 n=1 Tax=Papio anubis TaxID=9555 RepID=UPI0012AD474B|nr:prefoldin subunit 2 isoform X1 [Papio anubis]
MGSISVAQVKAPQVGFTAVDGTESRSYMKIWPKPLAGSDPEAGLEPEAPRRVGGNSQAGRDARRGLSCAGRKPSGRRRWRRTAVAPARAAGAARARGRCPQSSKSKCHVRRPKDILERKVIAGFNRLRQEQRGLASKAAELEMELNEHSLVIDTLKEVDETRKCYRMVGGVLVERTVKEVLPALENNKEQIQKIIETLTQQLQAKGKELNEFREKHNIRLMGEDEKPAAKENSEGAGAKASSAGVLVS